MLSKDPDFKELRKGLDFEIEGVFRQGFKQYIEGNFLKAYKKF
jgi:hypothetical protein